MCVLLAALAVTAFVLVLVGAVLGYRSAPWMEQDRPGLYKPHNLGKPSPLPMWIGIAGGVIGLVASLLALLQ